MKVVNIIVISLSLAACSTPPVVTDSRSLISSNGGEDKDDEISNPVQISGAYLTYKDARLMCGFSRKSEKRFKVDCDGVQQFPGGEQRVVAALEKNLSVELEQPQVLVGEAKEIRCEKVAGMPARWTCDFQNKTDFLKAKMSLKLKLANQTRVETQDVSLPYSLELSVGLVPSLGTVKSNLNSLVEGDDMLGVQKPEFPARLLKGLAGTVEGIDSASHPPVYCLQDDIIYWAAAGFIFEIKNYRAKHYAGQIRALNEDLSHRYRVKLGSITSLVCKPDGVVAISKPGELYPSYAGPARYTWLPREGAVTRTLGTYPSEDPPSPAPGEAIFKTVYDNVRSVYYVVMEIDGVDYSTLTVGSVTLNLNDISLMARTDNGTYYYHKNNVGPAATHARLLLFSLTEAGGERVVIKSVGWENGWSVDPSVVAQNEVELYQGNSLFARGNDLYVVGPYDLYRVRSDGKAAGVLDNPDESVPALANFDEIRIQPSGMELTPEGDILFTSGYAGAYQRFMRVHADTKKVETIIDLDYWSSSELSYVGQHMNQFYFIQYEWGYPKSINRADNIDGSNQVIIASVNDVPGAHKINMGFGLVKLGRDGSVYFQEDYRQSDQWMPTLGNTCSTGFPLKRINPNGSLELIKDLGQQKPNTPGDPAAEYWVCDAGGVFEDTNNNLFYVDGVGDLKKISKSGGSYVETLVRSVSRRACIPSDNCYFGQSFVIEETMTSPKWRSDNKIMYVDIRKNAIRILDLNQLSSPPVTLYEANPNNLNCGYSSAKGQTTASQAVEVVKANMATLCPGSLGSIGLRDNCSEPNGSYTMLFASGYQDGGNIVKVESPCEL